MNGNTDTNTNSNVAVMIHDKLNDKVVIIVANMTDLDEVFTAYNITEKVRIENPTMNIPHNDVKEMVFDLYLF